MTRVRRAGEDRRRCSHELRPILVSLIAVAAAAGHLGYGGAEPSSGTPRYVSRRSDGSDIRFTTIAEDGAVAGLKVLPDGTPHALYFDGKRLKDFSSKLGPVSAFTALNDRHQAAGYFSSNPAARVTNLFGANPDPSLMPHAFFMSGKTIKRRHAAERRVRGEHLRLGLGHLPRERRPSFTGSCGCRCRSGGRTSPTSAPATLAPWRISRSLATP